MPAGIDVIFLGTGGSLPTKDRGLPAVALRRDGELFLFDCGEGTQRQMMHARLGFNRPMSIMISHLHGDHILGLPGLLQTMSSLIRDKPLDLYGPEGVSSYLSSLRRTLGFAANFPVHVTELKPGQEVSKGAYTIKTAKAMHDIACLAYALVETDRPGRFHPEKAKRLGVPEGPLWKQLQMGKEVTIEGKTVTPRQVIERPRPGLKIVYAIDTRPTEEVKVLAKEADLLMHDGGFAEDRRDKAKEYFHSTAREAARLAKAARVHKLALVHISAVTRDDSILLKQARSVFKPTLVPKDLMILSLKRST
ncbi:MAG TPA: ribonuclease Z [Candidatus Bathyarchaeia archaeon]|nr:ribonuclease Z [Candidatus Bathyarchaeia archaeon]